MEKIEKFRADLRRFERAIYRLNKQCCFENISLAQCHTLMEIGLHEGLTLNDLADRLELDKSTISRTIDTLVKSEYVVRNICLADRRCVNLYLSSAGNRLFHKINEVNNSQFQLVFHGIEDLDLDNFLEVFQKISKSLLNQNTCQAKHTSTA